MRNRILLGTVLAALALLVTAEAAQAQFYVGGGRGGFSVGYGYPAYSYGYYGPRYYGGYYGYGYYPYRSYYYSPYAYSYSWPYTYSYPSDTTRYYYYGNGPVYPDSYYYASPPPAPPVASGEGRLRVSLPTPDAQLWIEDVAMRETGSERVFATPPLERGKTYTYHFRARWREGEHDMTRDKEVKIRAGEEVTVSFRD